MTSPGGADRRLRTRVLTLLMLLSLLTSVLHLGPISIAEAAPCDPPIANPIICENSKTGNPSSEWDISGAGDSNLQGFATDISVDQGQTVHFKVTTGASAYHVDVYRLGYYGGMGARRVATIPNTATVKRQQPACLNQGATGLIDCGNWSETASWVVPTDAVSGLYIARLVREDTGGASHVPFVVRDDDGRSDMLFQTSDTTWQAYNGYGGNSLYTGSPDGRAYKVSYNRPFTTRGGGGGGGEEDFIFNAEYPMIRWLERNGYNVSYSTGVDSDRRGAEILEHRVFMSVGHDEYWSGGQRTNVEAARAAGVDLAFFSGNEVFWKTRWENSIDGSGTPYRTLVCYKETHADAKIDPTPAWTGTWRDPRFSPPADGGRPENGLTGTIFMVNGPRTDSITVPAADGKMRFWRNTTIATLGAGQSATLPAGVLGYEWDEEQDNGFRPAGLIRLSSTTVSGVGRLQDYGSNYSSGSATHNLALYRHSSGALVFGGGTAQWSWGLDSNHDRGSAAADARMQQATVNLFADMGVQPGTLQSGLVGATASTDATAPTSAITSPAAGASISQNSTVTISGTAGDVGGQVGGVEVSTDGGNTWHRATGRATWTYSWTATVAGSINLKSRAADDSANIETPGAGVTVTVTSNDTTPPTISGVQATFITTTGATIGWTTNEASNTQVEYGTTTAYGSSTTLAPAFVTSHSQALAGLSPNTLYHYRVKSRDSAGNLATSADFTFATQADASSCPCSIWGSATTPAVANENDTSAVQVGVKFRANVAGQVTGVRFYKGGLNTGTHVGSLWSGTGTQLATATFSDETASGWQQVNFAAPVAIAANTTYVASYFAPVGRYAVNGAYFTAAVTNGPLTALASATETPGNGLYRYTATPAFPNATYNSENYWVDVVFTTGPDTTPPTISGVQATGITTTGATIGWTTNEASDSQVEYGTTTAYGSSTALNAAFVTSHSQGLSGLSPGTLYHYRVKSKDATSNLATSGDFTFTTTTPDTTPPTISNVQATGITTSGATITWTTDEAADTQVEYGLTTAYGSSTTLNTTLVTSHSQALSGLSASTLYHYRVKSKDAAGNPATSADFTFTTAAADTTPPVISNVQATGVSGSGATITWTTDEASDSQVEYGTTTAYGSQTTLNTALVTGHSQALSGLSPSTLYHYRVTSRDAAGNPATSGDSTFTTGLAQPTTLVGDTTLKSFVDENAAGVAEAFQYTASASGTADRIYVYVDAGNAATRLVVGIYANNASDNPSTLLAQATITAPTPGGWNTVALPAGATISAGTRYWIALLGPSGVGTARFRDGASGGRAQVSSQSNLTALPATWSSGDSYSNSPMSAYAVQSQ
jgi:hypothetical protein